MYFARLFVSLQFVMELNGKSVEELIAMVLNDINQKGYSSVQPFSIGKVEERMMLYAQANAITLASDELYMSAKQLQHCMRTSKATKGLVVENIELISFPSNRCSVEVHSASQLQNEDKSGTSGTSELHYSD